MPEEINSHMDLEILHLNPDMYEDITDRGLETFNYFNDRIPSVKESHNRFRVNITLSSLARLIVENEGILLKMTDETTGEAYQSKCFDGSDMDEWLMEVYDAKRPYVAQAVGIPELKDNIAGRIFSDGKGNMNGLIVKEFKIDDTIDMTRDNPSLLYWSLAGSEGNGSKSLDKHIESLLRKTYYKRKGTYDFVIGVSNDEDKRSDSLVPYTVAAYPFYSFGEK